MEIIFGQLPEGFGDGYCPGYGYGSGDGYGSGYGDGYGDGYGSGGGDGSGFGDGYGYGYGEYWLSIVSTFAAKWPKSQQQRLAQLSAEGATIAYWLSDADGRACNGGSNDAVEAGTIEESPGPLALCKQGTLHATLMPSKWSGERWWIVALTGEVVGDDEKFGALRREIIGECL